MDQASPKYLYNKKRFYLQFKEINTIASSINYQHREKYPLIQLNISFTNPSDQSSVEIYNYVKSYLNQDWNEVYAKYGLDIIRDLEYSFAKTPFFEKNNWDWFQIFFTYLQNLVNNGNKHSLDGKYFVDSSILKVKGIHNFKIAAIQFGEIGDKFDGTDQFTSITYQYISSPNTLPKVKSATFTPNPYNIAIPATPQQFIKPDQIWTPFKTGSVTFAPSYFVTLPFTALTAILHYSQSQVSPVFPKIFFTAIKQYLQKDINYIYNSNVALKQERSLFSFELTGLKENTFLLFKKLAATIPSKICNQSCFSASLENTIQYYSNFYKISSISNIIDKDQAFIQNPSLVSYENILNLLKSYNYADFLYEEEKFVKSISWQWLVITFKQQISVYHQAIKNLHSSYKIPIFKGDISARVSNNRTQEVNIYHHSHQNITAIRIYYDFGSASLQSYISSQIFDVIIHQTLDNHSEKNFASGIRFTVDGRIGYNLDLSSSTDNKTQLLNKLLKISKNAVSLNRWTASYRNDTIASLFQEITAKVNRKKFATINKYWEYLISFIHSQCYECITSWPLTVDQVIDKDFYLSKLFDSQTFLANYVQITQLPQ